MDSPVLLSTDVKLVLCMENSSLVTDEGLVFLRLSSKGAKDGETRPMALKRGLLCPSSHPVPPGIEKAVSPCVSLTPRQGWMLGVGG